MLRHALRDLARGRPVLLYDMDRREQETDMVVAGQLVSPETIATLRREAGGLVCVAIPARIARALGLPYLHEMMQGCGSDFLRRLAQSGAPYGGHPAFSITVNHRDTYTGITDRDRAKTIGSISSLAGRITRESSNHWKREFLREFRSPGHVHILIGSNLTDRQGHTELSLGLAHLAGLDPAMVVCEMLDGGTHNALSRSEAERYARARDMAFVEAAEIIDAV